MGWRTARGQVRERRLAVTQCRMSASPFRTLRLVEAVEVRCPAELFVSREYRVDRRFTSIQDLVQDRYGTRIPDEHVILTQVPRNWSNDLPTANRWPTCGTIQKNCGPISRSSVGRNGAGPFRVYCRPLGSSTILLHHAGSAGTFYGRLPPGAGRPGTEKQQTGSCREEKNDATSTRIGLTDFWVSRRATLSSPWDWAVNLGPMQVGGDVRAISAILGKPSREDSGRRVTCVCAVRSS